MGVWEEMRLSEETGRGGGGEPAERGDVPSSTHATLRRPSRAGMNESGQEGAPEREGGARMEGRSGSRGVTVAPMEIRSVLGFLGRVGEDAAARMEEGGIHRAGVQEVELVQSRRGGEETGDAR